MFLPYFLCMLSHHAWLYIYLFGEGLSVYLNTVLYYQRALYFITFFAFMETEHQEGEAITSDMLKADTGMSAKCLVELYNRVSDEEAGFEQNATLYQICQIERATLNFDPRTTPHNNCLQFYGN